MPHYLGVDIGGTTSTLAIGDEVRRVIAVSGQFPTSPDEGPAPVIEAIVEQAAAEAGRVGLSLSDIATVGLATPGPASHDGVLHMTPNLKVEHWDQFPIRAELEKGFQRHAPEISVRYIGDGQAAAYGEYMVRSRSVQWDRLPADSLREEELTSLFMVIVGTGLGGGAVIDGQPIRGRQGRAGHFGHILLPEYAFRHAQYRELRVGNALATAESAISLTGLAHQLGHCLSLDEWRDHPLNNAEGTVKQKAKKLRELAAAGDPLARQLFDDQARALGIALLCANYLGDYDRLVIGGGVCDLAPELRERYRKIAETAYHEHALEGFRDLDRLEFSVCGDDAPVIGALAWATP
ncbi:ROK family protein [Botrimarina mediterranea]|uniref:N-acetyl-D-glucosamine kinase n=1 Tax=Botrimarina mediterranea TaxID=2528022 RepID=A0A518K6W5_9BACT|nr:ROK family protein [Botrimarina mediterranea]QDV73539.1 N-acetyl-D-glucosamine kinase [Botrimarina mediterranea]QDV78130.1 N-acetyl-D-glucosamine kinase [Planctomycetes bacterium K2D]